MRNQNNSGENSGLTTLGTSASPSGLFWGLSKSVFIKGFDTGCRTTQSMEPHNSAVFYLSNLSVELSTLKSFSWLFCRHLMHWWCWMHTACQCRASIWKGTSINSRLMDLVCMKTLISNTSYKDQPENFWKRLLLLNNITTEVQTFNLRNFNCYTGWCFF